MMKRKCARVLAVVLALSMMSSMPVSVAAAEENETVYAEETVWAAEEEAEADHEDETVIPEETGCAEEEPEEAEQGEPDETALADENGLTEEDAEEPEDAEEAPEADEDSKLTSSQNVSGNINASDCNAEDLVLTGDTTLNMDEEKIFQSIRGDYSLTITGTEKLYLINHKGDAINTKTITIAPGTKIEIGAKTGMHTKGDIVSSGILTVVADKDGIVIDGPSGDVILYGETYINAWDKAVCTNGKLESYLKLTAINHNKKSVCIDTHGLKLEEWARIDGENPNVIDCLGCSVDLKGSVSIGGATKGNSIYVYDGCVLANYLTVEEGSTVTTTAAGGINADHLLIKQGSELNVKAEKERGIECRFPEIKGRVIVNSSGDAFSSENLVVVEQTGYMFLRSTDGRGLVISNAGETVFYGETTVKSFGDAIHCEKGRVRVVMGDLDLTSTNGKGIYAQSNIELEKTVQSPNVNAKIKSKESALFSNSGDIHISRETDLESRDGAVIDAANYVQLSNNVDIRQTGSDHCIRSRKGNIDISGLTYNMQGGKGIKAEQGNVVLAAKDVTVTCSEGAAVSAENSTIYIEQKGSLYPNTNVTVSGGAYGLKAKEIKILNDRTVVDAKGDTAAMYASEGISKPQKLSIVNPAGGWITAKTIVASNGSPAKEVLIKEQILTGNVTITPSEVVAGQTMQVHYPTGFPLNHSVQWQKKYGETDYMDILGATQETYPTKPGDVGWTFRARVYAEGYDGEVYSDGREVLTQPTLSGTITYNNSCTVDIPVNANLLNLNPSVSTLGDKLHYFWQVSLNPDSGFNQKDGAFTSSYTPTVGDIGKYLRIGVYADGYTGKVYGPARLVKKQLNSSNPVAPTLSVITPYNKITITNAKSDQEYTIAYPTDMTVPDPDWSTAVYSDANGPFQITVDPNKRVIVFTRMRETEIKVAGTKVSYSKIYNGQTQALQDIELSIRQVSPEVANVEQDDHGYYYVMPGKVYEITANPVPETATDFQGFKKEFWKIDGSAASSVYGRFFPTAACDTPFGPNGYMSVYYKPSEDHPKSGLILSASNNSGTVSDSITIAQGSTADGFKVQYLFMPTITVDKGQISNAETFDVRPEKGNLGTMTASLTDGEGTAPTVTFDTTGHTVTVDATSADAGQYIFSVKYQTSVDANRPLVVIVEPGTCAVTLDPGEGSCDNPVVDYVAPGAQYVLPGEPVSFVPPSGGPWIFDGWNLGELGSGKPGDGIIIETDITITAKWKKHTHKLTTVPEIPASCLMGGNAEYYYCPECGKYYSDKQGLHQEAGPGVFDIPALGHLPSLVVRENEIKANEDQDGSYDEVIYCSRCGDEMSRSHVVVARRTLNTVSLDATGLDSFMMTGETWNLAWNINDVADTRFTVSTNVELHRDEECSGENPVAQWVQLEEPCYVKYTISNNEENDRSLIFSKLEKENCTLTFSAGPLSGYETKCVGVQTYIYGEKSCVDITFMLTKKKDYAVKGPEMIALSVTPDSEGHYLPPAGTDIFLTNTGTQPVKFTALSDAVLSGEGADVFKTTAASYPVNIAAGGVEKVCTVEVKPNLTLAPNHVYEAELTLLTDHASDGAFAKVKLCFTVHPTAVTGIWMEDIPAQDYTGKKITPDVSVYWGETLLTKDDYTVSYKNNTNAYTLTEGEDGFDARKAPSVTIKGKRNYKGTFTRYFVINPADLTMQATAENVMLKWTGRKLKPTTTVTAILGGEAVTLKAGKDYAYEYIPAGYEAAGTYYITVRAKSSNFKGSQIFKAEVIKGVPMSKVSVSGIPNVEYNGITQKPAVTVKSGKVTLTPVVDYMVEYKNNRDVGTATVIITGTANPTPSPGHETYFGSVTKTFKITGTSIAKASMDTNAGYQATAVYTGAAIEQPAGSYALTLNKGTITIPDTCYNVTYENNIDTGIARIIFTGRPEMGYTGKLTKTFRITPYTIDDEFINVYYQAGGTEMIWQESTNPLFSYNQGGVRPATVVKRSLQTLVSGKDYTISYGSNTAVKDTLTGKNDPTVTIKGKGNFSGTITRRFRIGKKDFNDTTLTVIASDVTWQDKAGICNPAVTILENLTGKALKAGTDYYAPKDKVHPFTYEFVSVPATATVYNYINKVRTVVDAAETAPGKPVLASYILPEGAVIRVKITGKGPYTESVIASDFKFVKQALSITDSAFKITIPNMQWTGMPIELTKDDISVTYKVSKTETKTLVYGTDYEIVPGSYINNVNRGTAKVTIRGLDNGTDLYGGTKQVSFKIVQRRMNYAITYDAYETGLMQRLWKDLSYQNQQSALVKYGTIMNWYAANYRITGTMKSSETPYGGKVTANAFKVQKYDQNTKKWSNVPAVAVPFKGWAIKPGGDVVFTDKGVFKPSWMWRLIYDEDVTLYAVW
ncbi:MAG: hypothetical protein J6Y57_03135 [Lachnospiraceae bacterium]|nr:hypothetical protein [Lachnospiraceae bacterium]